MMGAAGRDWSPSGKERQRGPREEAQPQSSHSFPTRMLPLPELTTAEPDILFLSGFLWVTLGREVGSQIVACGLAA